MILILGARGYVGSAFVRLFEAQGVSYLPVSRAQTDYYDAGALSRLIRDTEPSFLINAAGYTGKPNVDACELHKADCLYGNAVLPGRIREVCEDLRLPWGHVSSGCIYNGKKQDGTGFKESDPNNFCFRTNNCSFYSGSKALGEEVLEGAEQCFIWRMRIPFDQYDSNRNYLSKLLRYDRLLDAENSISHLGDFVEACYQSWDLRIPWGTYNVTNPGSITTREIVEMLQKHLAPDKTFHFFDSEEQFMQEAAQTPRSNCILDTTKLAEAGLALRPVKEAILDSLKNWEPKKP